MKIIERSCRRAFFVLLVIISSAAGASAQDGKSFDLDLVDGQVQGDIGSLRVTQNDRVVLRWRTDRETEIHLHGYDLKETLSPDAVTEMEFEAHATGRFPITSHGHHTGSDGEKVLIRVEVYPN